MPKDGYRTSKRTRNVVNKRDSLLHAFMEMRVAKGMNTEKTSRVIKEKVLNRRPHVNIVAAEKFYNFSSEKIWNMQ